MRVLLAGPDFEENLSIRYLASSLQAVGHETPLAVFNSENDVEAVAEQVEDADIVGLSVCFQSRAQEFLTLARRIVEEHQGHVGVTSKLGKGSTFEVEIPFVSESVPAEVA